jgi:2-hydroxychromene-2-carboxylate isomerase
VDTSAALHWLAGLEGDSSLFVKRAFSAHWIDQTDINDSTVLQQLTADCGLSTRQEAINLDSLEREAEARGLFDAPTFFIEEYMFMGRAHIPLMRQLLTNMDCH